MKITYKENKNGIYYPNLSLPTGTTYSIEKYGRVYLDYLKKHRRRTYTTPTRVHQRLSQNNLRKRQISCETTANLAK